MTILGIVQVAFNVLFFAGIALCFFKLKGRREEDPRLSYGLKLLQNKIAVLEDLSDKTELQVKQLVILLETKIRDLQQKVNAADTQLARIDHSMNKSLEVANIFQEQIPHEQIMERKTSNKYINAARMAHQGLSFQDIQKQVDLPHAELDLIVKLNREQLMFSEDQLPAWVEKAPTEKHAADRHPIEANPNLFVPPQVDMESLEKLGQDFKQACKDFEQKMHPAKTEPEVVPYQFKKMYDRY
jgi:Protein of unknown function (DUF2802)